MIAIASFPATMIARTNITGGSASVSNVSVGREATTEAVPGAVLRALAANGNNIGLADGHAKWFKNENTKGRAAGGPIRFNGFELYSIN